VYKLERGVYFDGWYKDNHCYHPSLPIRNIRMIEDLEKYRGTLLVWSALGGGSISLSYLENEAFGRVDPRLRFYGFMNDSEYIAECNKRGIKVFGIVFEVQGWEFPVVLSEDQKEFTDFNLIKGDKPHDWYGLREFTSDKYPDVFEKKFRDYFPEGLYNSDGEEVTDIWDECCSRDFNGVPTHSEWVEVKGHAHQAYQMCRNNPVWRAYMKKIIEIQIDAGVAGVQLDECELPMTSIRYGGCFCKDCMKQFNAYLKELKVKGELPDELSDVDLDTFHYGDYLRATKLPYPGNLNDLPLYRLYWEYQLRAVKKHFNEMADFIREYGRKKGRKVLVSGNFFNIMPVYYPLETNVDVIITEMKQTLFNQVNWFRYVAGFAGDKPVIIAENPYGSVVIDLVEKLNKGKGYDLYRLLLIEASAYGCNMSVPYGAWMGNTVKDAFWPPREVTAQVQNFLADNERLYSAHSGANVLVLYSFPSSYWKEAVDGYSSSVLDSSEGVLSYSVADENDPNSVRLPFWEVTKYLSDKQIGYDVKFLADGDLREDTFSPADMDRYDLVVLPDCNYLTANQADVIEQFRKNGKKVVIFGQAAENLPDWFENIKDADGAHYCRNVNDRHTAGKEFWDCFEKAYKGRWQISVDNDAVGIQTHETDNGLAVHIVNSDYSESKDAVISIAELNLKVRMAGTHYRNIEIHTIEGRQLEYACRVEDNVMKITLHDLPLYTVVELIKQ
jgi:hypothetical protein